MTEDVRRSSKNSASVRLPDTHCHLNMDCFDADRAAVMARAAAAGVSHILVPALDIGSARRIVALAAHHPCLYAAIGIHPSETGPLNAAHLDELSKLALARKVVAIGEIGLDYYWVTEEARRAQQRDVLRAQLDLAAEYGLPAVLHMREEQDADEGACAHDMLRILDEWTHKLRARSAPLVGRAGVLHSFSGNSRSARQAIQLGFYIGVTGPITYRGAQDRRDLVGSLPLDRLLTETDAPFLSPLPHRGQRNEPAFVALIADRIAAIQSRTPQEVAQAISTNAKRLFAWGEPA